MPIIFKNIRRKLAAQNKTMAYMRYAIGEILLVVIGILIALQVNEWRDQYRSKQKELSTLQLLLHDLQVDANNLRVFQHMIREQEKATFFLLDYIPTMPSKDTLAKYARRAISVWNYRPTHPTYDGLKDNGQLGIISDPGIRNKVIYYFDYVVPYLNDLRINYHKRNEQAAVAMARYFGDRKGADSTWVYKASPNYRGLNKDQQTQNLIGDAGQSGAWLDIRIETIFLPENEKLQKVLTDYKSRLTHH